MDRRKELEKLLDLINGLPLRAPALTDLPDARDVAPSARDYVLMGDELGSPSERYDYLLEVRNVIEGLDSPGIIHSTALTMYWSIVEGRIMASPGKAIHILDGIEVDRIRRCSCSRWFYAYRSDRRACSTRCAARMAMQRIRS